jgi:hypothetical protein
VGVRAISEQNAHDFEDGLPRIGRLIFAPLP